MKSQIETYLEDLVGSGSSLQQEQNQPALTDRPAPSNWIPPATGKWKLSCDAAWSERRKQGGLGWILRHWDGSPLMAGYRCIKRPWKISWLEITAICEGLRALLNQTPKICVESDNLQVVTLLKDKEEDLSEILNFIQEAKVLIEALNIKSIEHVNRLHNGMTHYLATKACQSGESMSWNSYFPNWLVELNNVDIEFQTNGGSCPIVDIPMESLSF